MAKQTRRRASRKQTRRHRKQRGGEGENASTNVPPAPPAAPKNNMVGGKRKSRKLSPWNKFVKKVYHDMKAKDKSVTFSEALKEASKRKKEM